MSYPDNHTPGTFSTVDFIRGFIECGQWADTMAISEDGGETDFEIDARGFDVDAQSLAAIERECAAFAAANHDDLLAYCERVRIVDGDTPEAYAGHDFWLTRNGHGAGFWDRGMDELGDRLTQACRPYGEIHFVVSGTETVEIL